MTVKTRTAGKTTGAASRTRRTPASEHGSELRRRRALVLLGNALVRSGDATKYIGTLPSKEREFIEETLSPWMAAKDEADFFLLSPLRGSGIKLGKIKLKEKRDRAMGEGAFKTLSRHQLRRERGL